MLMFQGGGQGGARKSISFHPNAQGDEIIAEWNNRYSLFYKRTRVFEKYYFSWWPMLHMCLAQQSCGKEREDKNSL